MTRDEAIKIWLSHLRPTDERGPNWTVEQWAAGAITAYEQLGMLDLDEPKSSLEKFKEALKRFGYNENATSFKEAVAAFHHSQNS